MPEYRPPRRLMDMKQVSPSGAMTRPRPADGSRLEIVFEHHSPTEFRHQHYVITLERSPARTGNGTDVVEVTAQARIDVPDLAGPVTTDAAVLSGDQDVADGVLRATPARSPKPELIFPPVKIAVADPDLVEDMSWRALQDAVMVADQCLDTARQVALLRAEQIEQAENQGQ